MADQALQSEQRTTRARGPVDALQFIARRLDELAGDMRRLYTKLDERVDALEAWHIEEQTRTKTRMVERTRQLERWQKRAVLGGLLGALAGVASAVVMVVQAVS